MECYPTIIKGHLTLISGILTNLITGSSLSMISILFYYFSYFNHSIQNTNRPIVSIWQVFAFSENYYYIIFSLIITFSNLTNSFSTYFTYRINIKVSLLIAYISLMASSLILFSNFSYSIFTYFSFALYGFGVGFSYQTIIFNVWKFFPNSKSFMSFLLTCAFSASSPIFHFACSEMISINKETGELNANEVKVFLCYCFLMYFCFMIFAIILSFDYYFNEDDNDGITENTSKLLTSSISERRIKLTNLKIARSNMISMRDSPETPAKVIEYNLDRNNSFYSNTDNLLNKSNPNCRINEGIQIEDTSNAQLIIFFKKIISNNRIYFIISIYFFSFIYSFNTMLTLILYQNQIEFSFKTIEFNTSFFILIVSISRIIIPLIFNSSNSLKVLHLFVLLIQCQISFSIERAINYDERLYLPYVIISGICYTVNSISISSLIQKIYGDELAMIITGFVIGFSTLSVWIVCLEGVYLEQSDKLNKFHLMFIVSGISSIIAFGLRLYLKDTMFKSLKIRKMRNDIRFNNINDDVLKINLSADKINFDKEQNF